MRASPRLPRPPANIGSMTLGEAIRLFLKVLDSLGWSPKTIKVYRAALRDFSSSVGPERPMSEITSDDYLSWLSLDSRRVREGSIRRSTAHYYSIMVRRFLRWTGVGGDMHAYGRGERRFKGSLRWGEVLTLLQASRDVIDALIVSLLAETGLRVSEFLSITLRDIDMVKGSIRVKGKYGKEREVFLGPISRSILEEYLSAIGPRRPNDRLVNISYQAVYKRLKKLAERAGVDPERVRPHVLRHTFATEALRRGMSLPSLQRLLGHSDIKVTQLYLHLTNEDVRSEYQSLFHHTTLAPPPLPTPHQPHHIPPHTAYQQQYPAYPGYWQPYQGSAAFQHWQHAPAKPPRRKSRSTA